jgi:hypothetical protein
MLSNERCSIVLREAAVGHSFEFSDFATTSSRTIDALEGRLIRLLSNNPLKVMILKVGNA